MANLNVKQQWDTTLETPTHTCMSRLLCTASSMPVSMVMTPATHAAAISPTLWPSTASGTMPRERHSWPATLERKQRRLRGLVWFRTGWFASLTIVMLFSP